MNDWVMDRTYAFRGQEVAYRIEGAGPPLVFVHGTPFSSYVWRRIAPLFAGSHTVFCYDLLGYGQSCMQAGQDVSLGVQNALLSELLDHWEIDNPDVVAHDFGGATALRAHLIDRRDYRSLTLIDPVAIAPWGSPFVQHVRAHGAAFDGLPAYIHEAIVQAYIRGAIRRDMSPAELAPYVRPWLGARGQAGFYRQIAQMDQRYTDEIEPHYGSLRCPAQVLWGEDDGWIPLERGRQFAKQLPAAHFSAVPEAGHLVQEDAPEALVAALIRFLAIAQA